jgi:Na+-translocating ferredoxin:NAD+ oxidoreductase RnfG subunit
MNKLVKLPLFLGIVGGLCGGLLALTNYFTGPKIEADENARIAAAYQVHFPDIQRSDEKELSATLIAAGVSNKIEAFDGDNKQLGSIYTATVKGYGGNLTFTVSFAGQNVNKFIQVSGSESSVGVTFLDAISNASNFNVSNISDYKSGSSVTYNAVNNCIQVCYSDYIGG